jgi:type IV secretion system protein VirB8
MSTDAALERYFAEAASWDADRAAMSARSARVAWRIAFLACAVSMLAIAALVLLMPLKRVEPFVIRVDNATGIVDVVPVFVGKADLPEVVSRYFLTHYVTVCERFTFATAESDYEECAAFHAAARNQAWVALWDRGNPASPLHIYRDGSAVRAQVRAVSFFKRANGVEDLAQIRYTKTRRTGASATDQITHWIATVQYLYGEPSKNPAVRRWNPLGFKVVEFRSEPETLPSDEGPRSSDASAAASVGGVP